MPNTDKDTSTLNAAEIYAIKANNAMGRYFETGDRIQFRMGYNPDYNNIECLELINDAMYFDGNTVFTPTDENENTNNTSVDNKNNILNQIAPSTNPNTHTNTTISNQNTNSNASINNQNQGGIVDEGEYYYKQLNQNAKVIYNKLKENKENMKSGKHKIEFGDTFNELLLQEGGADLLQEYYQSAIETYLYDNPDIFYIDPTKMYLNIQTTKKLFTTTYDVYLDWGENSNYFAQGYFSKEQILNYEEKINQEIQTILSEVQGKNKYEKLVKIHDYLVDNVKYEETISKSNIYNIYGTLVKKESVCEGYAKAFKYLMDQIGIETIVVIGTATDSNGKSQNHAWNYVYFNNKWYAVDVTWDDPIIIGGGWLTKKSRYKYFLKGSTTMAKDHKEAYTFIDNGTVYELPALSVNDYK